MGVWRLIFSYFDSKLAVRAFSTRLELHATHTAKGILKNSFYDVCLCVFDSKSNSFRASGKQNSEKHEEKDMQSLAWKNTQRLVDL